MISQGLLQWILKQLSFKIGSTILVNKKQIHTMLVKEFLDLFADELEAAERANGQGSEQLGCTPLAVIR